ncbi:hypothetical protein OG292_18140 [Streptomyces sp. NBC_01511]|uniref:hypothetical protein n=1 Tax=unclassified Streptomyces TaxID=2593676 RepID=UPI0038648A3A
MLRLLAGRERPGQGRIIPRADGVVGCLAQDGGLPPETTAQRVIEGALGDLRATEARMRRPEAAMAGGDGAALDAYGEAVSACRTWTAPRPWAPSPGANRSGCGRRLCAPPERPRSGAENPSAPSAP